MTDDEFLLTLIQTPSKTLAKLRLPSPPRYVIRVRLTLLDGADRSHAFARETLMRLWGVHGHHTPQAAPLPQAVAHLIQLGRSSDLEFMLGNPTRHTLPDRLCMIGGLLTKAHLPLNYALLLPDVVYFGPAVAQRWRIACQQAQRTAFQNQEHT